MARLGKTPSIRTKDRRSFCLPFRLHPTHPTQAPDETETSGLVGPLIFYGVLNHACANAVDAKANVYDFLNAVAV